MLHDNNDCGGRGPSLSLSHIGLAIATARLNRELWTQRNQFTHEQLPSDSQFILAKHELRPSNHSLSEKFKNPLGLVPNSPPVQVGDLVYPVSDKDKSRACDRYIVVSTEPPWYFVKKFSGSQLRASSYKVKSSLSIFPVNASLCLPALSCPTTQALQFTKTRTRGLYL